ncbi:hypothetical protein F5887DRAFT_169977 [Amanita rubescens]|nr:hypothetical protein F5887DRAFT_169977 [Amanita rubescens]
MAHLTVWTKTIFFYAIGNTPAVCLTSELPPEQSADILLLGCGDVRNIMYTVYADLGGPSRPLDFTCCDIDPAILARNILLYTLLADFPPEQDDEYLQKIWNFYYHFFIDKGTLDMILKQCQALVDLSPDITTWNNSKYGFLRFSSLHSLSTIRKHWTLYIGTKDFSKSEMDSLRAEFRKGSRVKGSDGATLQGFPLTSLRSAGPLWKELADIGPKQSRRYWETGVTFDEQDKLAKANEINPTFAFSAMGKGFALHYGSDPVLPFHLAKILAPISGSGSDETVTISSLIKGAMEEFKSWCLAFRERTKKRASLVIRFLVGDVISVCRALHYCAVNSSVDPGLYTAPWSTTLMKLDGGDYVESASNRAPLQFDVIDTSNLTDHFGLLNILVPCKPLMQTRPSSVIFTNALLSDDDDGMARDGFFELLCGDLSVLSMILDLIPVSYISNLTSHCGAHEMLLRVSDSSHKQFHKHIAWRIGTVSDSTAIGESAELDQRLKFDEEQLADFVSGVYQNMFSSEDLASMLQPGRSHRGINKLTKPTHYSRFTLAYILRVVKDKADVNWDRFMGRLYSLIADDRSLIFGSNNLQDLFCSLHLLDVYSFPPFSPHFNANVNEGPLARWTSVPPVVCISFQVPRKSFDILEKFSAKQIGVPVLICTLKSPSAYNVFPTYQSFWGNVKAEYGKNSSQEPKVTFEEDLEGIRGSSSAVFTFYVPAWILGANGQQEVTLAVLSSLYTVKTLSPVLGPYLTLFSAELTNRRHVHITQERPGNPGELQKLRNLSFSRPTAQEMQPLRNPVKITLDSAGCKVAFLTGRANVQDVNAKASLANGAAVSVNQISPRVVQISIGSHLQNIVYPFPVNSTDSKSRIARKSSYVEIDVRISGPLEKLGMSLKPFPVIQQDKTLSLWNIHYVDLERLPVLDLSSPDRLSFLPIHIVLSYSDRERRLCKAQSGSTLKTSDLDVITRVKQSIHHLILIGCGLEKGKHSVFGLTDPENGDIYTLIFVNGVCLDLASHTVVVDACFLPLAGDLVSRLSNAIGTLGDGTGLMRVLTEPDEVKAWKHLLPAFTERCRKWSHTANCEYLSRGVPVSEEIAQSPLCSCGRGKNLGAFSQKKNWEEFVPYVTRAAISPLFPVSFIDSVGADLMDAFQSGREVQKDKNACAKCHGPGKPKLLLCGACRDASYCSTSCQKADWKVHKQSCKKV